MPIKARGRKDAKHAAAHRLRKNPLLTGSPEEIDALVDGMNNVPEMREAIKVLAKTVSLMLKRGI